MFFIAVFSILTVFMNSFVSIEVLESRGFELNNTKKVSILLIMSFAVLWTAVYIDNINEFFMILFILPIMCIISLIDAKEKLVYDEDVICGIIIETAVLIISGFREFIYFLETAWMLNPLNCLKMIIMYRIRVSTYLSDEILGSILKSNIRELVLYSGDFFRYGIYFNKNIYESFLGIMVLFTVTAVLAKVTKSVGAGDVLYFSLLGVFPGFFGCMTIFFLSFMACSLYCIILIIMNRDFQDGLISFTPFISIGFIIFCCIAV